jgi:anti-sigma factor RsiW
MRCEDVRPVLAAYSGGELFDPGRVEVHLASCSGCSRELARYREVAVAIAALGDALEAPPVGLRERILADVPSYRVRDDLRRIVQDHPRARVAAVSFGGVVLGAAAIGLIWWRAARRAVAVPAPGAVSLEAREA